MSKKKIDNETEREMMREEIKKGIIEYNEEKNKIKKNLWKGTFALAFGLLLVNFTGEIAPSVVGNIMKLEGFILFLMGLIISVCGAILMVTNIADLISYDYWMKKNMEPEEEEYRE